LLIVYLLGSRLLGVAQCAEGRPGMGGTPKISVRLGRSGAAQIL
jgi:hypothetical protein